MRQLQRKTQLTQAQEIPLWYINIIRRAWKARMKFWGNSLFLSHTDVTAGTSTVIKIWIFLPLHEDEILTGEHKQQNARDENGQKQPTAPMKLKSEVFTLAKLFRTLEESRGLKASMVTVSSLMTSV